MHETNSANDKEKITICHKSYAGKKLASTILDISSYFVSKIGISVYRFLMENDNHYIRICYLLL